MSVSEAVAVMAGEIERQLGPLSTMHSRMIGVLKEMPQYVTGHSLGEWESAYRESTIGADESDATFRLIESIYELGAFNLFGAFDALGIEKYYRQLVGALAEKGFAVSGGIDVSTW